MALSFQDLENLWLQAGGAPGMAATMAAIALAESGGNPGAANYTDNNGRQTSWGLWQISDGTHNVLSGWNDPLTNARYALQKITTQGLGAWGTYTSGLYKQYLGGNAALATVPTGQQTGGASNANPQVPNANDIPALDAYIRQNYPNEAWLLDVPEVKQVLEQGVAAGWNETQIKAQLQNTAWWKHTSQAQINYLNMQHATPEELNFGDPGSKASQALAHVYTLAGNTGLQLPLSVLKGIALNSLQYGWGDEQVQAKIGSYAWVHPAAGGVASNDPALLAQLTGLAGKYLYNPTDTVLNSYVQGLASKTMSLATFQAFLAQQASTKYPYMQAQIAAGQTPDQIVSPLRDEAARTMEVAPGQVNFISDPMYAKILNFRPPATGGGGGPGPARAMTTSEMNDYLRGTDQWSYTQQARDTSAALSRQIVNTFGKVKL